jgi:hypothetical protein
MNVRAGMLLIGLALVCSAAKSRAADSDRHVAVWIIPPEESSPNDIAQGEDIPARSIAKRRRAPGDEDRPLVPRIHSSEFSHCGKPTPIHVIKRSTTSTLFCAAKRASAATVFRPSFARPAAVRKPRPDALPDVIEVGTTWTADLAAHGKFDPDPTGRRAGEAGGTCLASQLAPYPLLQMSAFFFTGSACLLPLLILRGLL